ncbi:beta strand repeat-containing protein [Mycolicibacterium sphagni]|uniref:Cadherin domain-containing protein n=1 Tax=Mycolicibacterium sphagni TaxID=1786 RepID=A0A255DUX9_9MYCO|nr:Ig-like domain-containing protein [Mycolicibacterium sphagni]OYN80802.1 hypothetical protein CG716_08105 [Mycolicibacterium sphagni]
MTTVKTTSTAKVATAAKTATASDAPLGSPAQFVATLQAILNQLVGWPEPPTTKFVTSANYALDQALDAHDITMDLLVANPTAATKWIPDTMALVNLFFKSALPGYTFSSTLNVLGSLLNRIVPPYQMATSSLSEAQVAGAAVGALVDVLNTLLAGDYNVQDLENAASNGGQLGALRPYDVMGMTFSSSAAPNLFSIVCYVALVAVYDRFKQVGLDHLPVFTGYTQGTQVAFSVPGQINAYDPDDDDLTYTFTEPSEGTVSIGADGSFLYTRSTNQSHSDTDTFTVTISDVTGQNGNIVGQNLDHPYAPDGHTITETITVHYTGTADNAPTAAIVVGTRDGMGVVRGSVNGNDIDGDTLTYSLVNPGTTGATTSSIYTSKGAIVELNTATGAFTYIPTSTSITTDSFQVLVSDGRGGTTTQTVVETTWLSLGTATTGTSAYVENGKVNVPSGDSGLLSYTLGTGPAKGTVVVNADGTYTYTRNTSLSSSVSTSDTFTIVATDANGKSFTLPTVSVSPPLETITATTTATGGTFTPRTMLNGTATVPGTQTTTGTFSGVDANGNAVTVAAGSYTSADGATVTVTSGGGFLYTLSSYSDVWHKAAATNAPTSDKYDTVNINVTDSLGGTTPVTFSVALKTENSSPSSSSSVGSADGLGVVRGTVNGSDSDGDSLTYSLVGTTGTSEYTANGGIVTLTGNSFVYTPNKSASTSDSFQVLVSDGHGGTTTATVSVPLGTPSGVANVNTATAGTVTGQLSIPAADSGLMTYSLGTGPSKGSVVVNADGTFTYVRTAGLGHTTTPADSFTVIGTNVATGMSVTIATINVAPTVADTAPVGNGLTVATSALNDTDASFNRQQTTTGTLNATDADGDTVTFAAGTYSTTNGGSVTVNANGTFTYTSQKMLKGTQDLFWHNAAVPGAPGDTFTIAISDGFGGTTNVVYSIPIQTLNSPPSSTVSVSVSGTDGLGVVRGTITGSDPDSYYNYITLSTTPVTDTLTYSLAGAGNTAATATSATTTHGGIVQLNGTSFTYIPTAGVTSDSFNVLVSDGHGGNTVATVNLSSLTTPSPVTNVNTSTTGVETGQLNVPSGDTGLTYSLGGTSPSKGSVVVNSDGSFTYTRTAGLGHSTTPNDSFTIKATDSSGRSVTIATINVTPTVSNAAPTVSVVTAATVGTRSGTTQTTTGKISWSDADGDAVTINGQAAPTGTGTITLSTVNGGTVVLKGDGTYTYTRTVSNAQSHAAAKIGAADSAVNDYINITVADAYGGSNTLAVKVPVYATNSAPTISGGTKFAGNINTITVNDADGDSLSFSDNGSSFTYGGLGVGTSTLWGGTTLTVTDGYYVVVNGVVTSTPASTTKSW